MNQNLTELIFVLDASGSMFSLADDTIGGFNGMIQSQKEKGANAIVTTVLFNTNWKMLHDGLNIQDVEPMTREQYQPGGGTALLDAVGDAINEVQDCHDSLPADERPAHVLFVITTDGAENSSTHYKLEEIQRMIRHQTNAHGWEFLYMGANVDAFEESRNLNISNYVSYTADSVGLRNVYTTMDCAVNTVMDTGTLIGTEGINSNAC